MPRPETSVSQNAVERGILDLLARRAPGKTICPSEVARALGGTDWRDLMEPVRRAAWRLAETEQVVVLKGGVPIARNAARGPIRIARRADIGSGETASPRPQP